jgi:subfamily B ATP-binding cassette protein HlyB/CyaB
MTGSTRPVEDSSREPRPEPLEGIDPEAESPDTGLRSLAGIALALGVRVDPAVLAHDLALGGRKATTKDLVRAAGMVGLKAHVLSKQGTERLETAQRPAILRLRNGRYAVIGRRFSLKHRVFYSEGKPSVLRTTEEILQEWSGELILITRSAQAGSAHVEVDPAVFGFRWFLPSIWRYRRPLAHVLVASLFIQLFALVTPLFFQVVVDKVLVHNSVSTLLVVVISLALIGLFDVTLQYLRSYALSHTASRLDVELGRRLFAHLLRLPLAYFETRAAGQMVARVRELETIRSFLTGQGVTSLIDIVFAIVLFAVLLLYSVRLTIVVAVSIPVYTAIAAFIRPVLRDKIKEKFYNNASSQQFLVESIVGAYTLKAAAVEPLVQSQWEEKLAAYVKTSFQAAMLGNLGQNAIQYVEKLATALILYFGARAVIAGDMTVGSLIAFNMISNQCVAPILRLSQLWQDFQQVQISIDRLGDILKSPPESQSNELAHLAQMSGAISFRDVVFRYRDGLPDVLRGISFDIAAGQVIGIVGPSGSGKSTLTKLVQRLYVPQQGEITIDGVNINTANTVWIRQQIGVVLQENFLFNKTVHDNIALAAPHMSREGVVRVAKLAGADEFLGKLPQGYDTQIEERGANLSGGQRQRIAIARALTRNPRILILDEATSALDYESERIIQENMKQIVRGRTVIIVAHRLAAVRHCDRIIGMVDGRIVEDGTHDELLQREHGLYRRLWALQNNSARL